VVARSEWVCGRSLAGIASSNPAGGMHMFLVSVVSCQVEVFVTGISLVQRSPTECGLSECDGEASIMRYRPNVGFCAMETEIVHRNGTPSTKK
jgi:hypothetical protein